MVIPRGKIVNPPAMFLVHRRALRRPRCLGRLGNCLIQSLTWVLGRVSVGLVVDAGQRPARALRAHVPQGQQ